jgi:hypothetical protein
MYSVISSFKLSDLESESFANKKAVVSNIKRDANKNKTLALMVQILNG